MQLVYTYKMTNIASCLCYAHDIGYLLSQKDPLSHNYPLRAPIDLQINLKLPPCAFCESLVFNDSN
jgi:hypothetical protein